MGIYIHTYTYIQDGITIYLTFHLSHGRDVSLLPNLNEVLSLQAPCNCPLDRRNKLMTASCQASTTRIIIYGCKAVNYRNSFEKQPAFSLHLDSINPILKYTLIATADAYLHLGAHVIILSLPVSSLIFCFEAK